MKILVTGVSGFIGAALARAAVDRGHTVVGVDRSPPGRLLPEELELIEGDITRPAPWRSAFRGVDAVVHSAAVHRSDQVAGGPIRSICAPHWRRTSSAEKSTSSGANSLGSPRSWCGST